MFLGCSLPDDQQSLLHPPRSLDGFVGCGLRVVGCGLLVVGRGLFVARLVVLGRLVVVVVVVVVVASVVPTEPEEPPL